MESIIIKEKQKRNARLDKMSNFGIEKTKQKGFSTVLKQMISEVSGGNIKQNVART